MDAAQSSWANHSASVKLLLTLPCGSLVDITCSMLMVPMYTPDCRHRLRLRLAMDSCCLSSAVQCSICQRCMPGHAEADRSLTGVHGGAEQHGCGAHEAYS